MLEAWRRSGLAGRARPTICGSFWSSYRALLAPALAQPGVETPGFVTDVPGLLRSADVLALPSLEEGSALVTYEAQASGCALLVSRQSGAVLTHGEQGLLHEAGDVDTLAAHLRQLERDQSMLERLRCRALAARKSLTWDHAGTILHAAYERSRAAMSLLCTARYVVTDRLHAHILCLLLGIPHSVFDNSYGKVSGTFEAWTSDSDLVHWATSADEALERCREFAP